MAAIADAVAAASSHEAGLEALHEGAGRAFDPELVEVFEDVAMARSPGLVLAA